MAYHGGHESEIPSSEDQVKIPPPNMTNISREQFEQKIDACNKLQEKYDRLWDEVEQLRTSRAQLEIDLENARDIQVKMESTCAEKDASYRLLQETFDRNMKEMETLRACRVDMEESSAKRDAAYKEMQKKYEEEKNEVTSARMNLSRMESTCKEKDISNRLLLEKYDLIMNEVKTLRAGQAENDVASERLQKKNEDGENEVTVDFAFYKQLQQKYSEEMNRRAHAAGCFASWKYMSAAHKQVESRIMQSIFEKYTEGKQRENIVRMIELHMDLCLENRKENQPDIFINRLIERRAEVEYLKKIVQEKKNHVIAAKVARDYWKKNKYVTGETFIEEEKDLNGFIERHCQRLNP